MAYVLNAGGLGAAVAAATAATAAARVAAARVAAAAVLLARAVAVRVPATALQDEVAASDQPAKLLLAALGALLERGFADALLHFHLSLAGITGVCVGGHGCRGGKLGSLLFKSTAATHDLPPSRALSSASAFSSS